LLVAFVGSVLVVNAIVGERGLMATRAARLDVERLASDIDLLKAENTALRAHARELRTDPAAIESVARAELGLLRPGEIVFLLNDGPGVRRR
jgi:cell division protein FtsB